MDVSHALQGQEGDYNCQQLGWVAVVCSVVATNRFGFVGFLAVVAREERRLQARLLNTFKAFP